MLEPGEPHLDVIEWIQQNRPLIEQKLAEHAGILFRGFELDGIQGLKPSPKRYSQGFMVSTATCRRKKAARTPTVPRRTPSAR